MVDETIDGGESHGGIRQDPILSAKRLIGSEQHRSSLVACADELEQHACLGLIDPNIGEDDEFEAMEVIDGGLSVKFAAATWSF